MSARPTDLPEVLRLLRQAGLPADGAHEHFPHFLVARRDREVVAAVGLEPYGTAGLLRSLVVAPAHRGHGLGRGLVDRLLKEARARGIRRVFLLTETAAEFFATLGFRRIAREEVDDEVRASVEFVTACSQSAACMRLDI